MEKLRLRYPVIVEGRYDKGKLLSFLEGDIIQTDGFRLFSDKEKLDLIKRLAEKEDRLVVLTDSDRAGFLIRGHIAGAVPPEKLIHVYIPPVPGKEKRKSRPSAEGILGVEGMEVDLLREALEKAGALGGEPPKREPVTKGDLYSLGLSGGEGSAILRRRLLRQLGLPEGISANALPGLLTRLTTLPELQEITAKLREEESV